MGQWADGLTLSASDGDVEIDMWVGGRRSPVCCHVSRDGCVSVWIPFLPSFLLLFFISFSFLYFLFLSFFVPSFSLQSSVFEMLIFVSLLEEEVKWDKRSGPT